MSVGCVTFMFALEPRVTGNVHIGALRLPLNGNTQVINETDIYYSGIYVEDSGPTTTP